MNKRISAEEHARRLALVRKGLSDEEAAKQLGNVTKWAVYCWRRTYGIAANKRRYRSKKAKEKLKTPYDKMKYELQEACDFRKLRQPGVPIWRSVAEHYGVDPTEAYNHIQQLLWDEEDYG